MEGRLTEVDRTLPVSGPVDPERAAWAAWRPEQIVRVLNGVRAPWYVAGGWAIDLFLGAERRAHEDLEIAVPSDRFGQVVEALDGFELFVVGPGLATPLAQARELLATSHQTWALERASGLWRLDVFREPSDGDSWICRRDARIRMPYEQLVEQTSEGIPYGRPEVVLLFKAKGARPKDDEDLAAVLPLLEPERRRWFAEAVARVHPGHRWLTELDG